MKNYSFFFSSTNNGTGYVTSGFGPRTHPVTKVQNKPHNGIDLRASEGTPVLSLYNGTVIVDNDDPNSNNGGIGVKIMNDNKTYSYYGHLQSNTVTNNQPVTNGQVIGNVGQTGAATGPHLHYGLQDENGKPIDPTPSLDARKKEQSNYSQFKNGDKDAEKDEFERALQARDERKSITKVTTDEATEKALDGQKAGAQQNQDAKDKEADEVAKEQEKSDGGSTPDPKDPSSPSSPSNSSGYMGVGSSPASGKSSGSSGGSGYHREAYGAPIVLDLDGDGKVELINQEGTSIYAPAVDPAFLRTSLAPHSLRRSALGCVV